MINLQLTEYEGLLLKILLEQLSELQSRQGCNDFNLAEVGLTSEEIKEACDRMDYISNPNLPEDEKHTGPQVMDYMVTSLFEYKLKKALGLK